MLDVSLLHGQVMQTNIPTVTENGHGWEKILLWCTNRNKKTGGLTQDEVEAVEFMKCCLELDPAKRISAADALKHPFITDMDPDLNPATANDPLRRRPKKTS